MPQLGPLVTVRQLKRNLGLFSRSAYGKVGRPEVSQSNHRGWSSPGLVGGEKGKLRMQLVVAMFLFGHGANDDLFFCPDVF